MQDWGVTYDDLEPFYERFEKIAGVSGKAGVLNGKKIDGANIFEGNRKSEFPLPPLATTRLTDLFTEGTQKLGLHRSWCPPAKRRRPKLTRWACAWGPAPIAVYGCGTSPSRAPMLA